MALERRGRAVILPVPVFLNRLAAPRCVLSFCIFAIVYASCRLVHRLRADSAPAAARAAWRCRLLAGQDRVHLVALLPRHRLGHRHVRQVLDQPLQDPVPDLGVRHLAAAEEDRRLHLVAVLEEALDVLLLELVVVLVDLRPELDFLDLDHLLVLLRLARPLLLLVLILAVVHDPADRRHGGGRDLHEVEALLLGRGSAPAAAA